VGGGGGWWGGGGGDQRTIEFDERTHGFQRWLLDVFKNIGNHGFYISIGYLDFLRTMKRK